MEDITNMRTGSGGRTFSCRENIKARVSQGNDNKKRDQKGSKNRGASNTRRKKASWPLFILPVIPSERRSEMELEIYVRFMRHLRQVPTTRKDIRILSSIQFTADMLDLSDALVARTLVEQGLRAPRGAFPAVFLDHIDRSLMRSGLEIGGPCADYIELREHWDRIGEDKFAAVRKSWKLPEPESLVRV